MSERMISMGTTSQGVNFNLIMRLDLEEMTKLLNADQISAVMQGITKVLNVGKRRSSKGEMEQPSSDSDGASPRLGSKPET